MPDQDTAILLPRVRGDWVRLRTLTVLRWIAVAGQLATIVVAGVIFKLELNLALILVVVGASVTANLVAILVYPRNTRLSERELQGMLLFDAAQLSALLALAGGLNNPFALLLLVPVTISATALRPRSTVLLGGATILMISLVAIWHAPLRTVDGDLLQMPRLFVWGFWVAIVIGVMFLAVYARRVTAEVHAMSDALAATQMALAREQKLTDLGGVVAAAAHELGTPLATIKLASSELADELGDKPELAADAALIREQADRCRDILRSMGRSGKDDLHLRIAPLSQVVQDAAEPHAQRGRSIVYDIGPGDGGSDAEPSIQRRPEVIHGLRNLTQNAVDFATRQVQIRLRWTQNHISITITDDGPGFPPQILGRIGDPFVRHPDTSRPGYDGMGLGLFIAKTLLERSGANLVFSNLSEANEQCGARVVVTWPMDVLAADRMPLGPNQRFEV
ncbi:MAG: ActS/PrrB/RegB family redox-sensitive histidine kinase [Rhodobacteraceae bacterium]|nr:ActS/PrrB/RegB family redox-sensitive histidine kinase [Paracoccaceae bacterium]